MMTTTAGFLLLTVLQISGFRDFLFDRRRQSDVNLMNYRHWISESRDELSFDNNVCPYLKPYHCKKDKYRSLNGKCNNLKHPLWGGSSTPYVRFIPPAYEDGKSTSRGKGRNGRPLMNPAFIRHFLFSSNTNLSVTRNINEFKVYFGQFVTHDIAKTAGLLFSPRPKESICCNKLNLTGVYCIAIPTPPKFLKGQMPNCYSFFRSLPTRKLDCNRGSREQKNLQSSYLDLSSVYGTSEYGLNYLRLMKKGMIKMVKCGDDILLPPDWQDIIGCQDKEYPCMLAGDLRLNQHPILTILHIIWTLEHNRVAEKLYNLNPQWTDERLFQEASKLVRAEYQHIVYNELLPIIIGDAVMKQYGLYSEKMGYHFGYNKKINAGIRNGFAAGAYRYAHSMIDDSVTFSGGCPYASKKCQPEKFANIKEQLFRPSVRHGCTMTIYRNLSQMKTANLYQHMTGGTEIMRGLLMKRAQLNNDLRFSEDLSLRMFDGRIELFTYDIQRGRDHGLPGYNTWRRFCNLSTAHSFRNAPGGLVDHPRRIARKLGRIYNYGCKRRKTCDHFNGRYERGCFPFRASMPTFGLLYLACDTKHDITSPDFAPGGLVDHPRRIARKLAQIYNRPDDIDLLLGGLTEIATPGQGIVGPLFKCIIGLQFKLLKEGDRFWYENGGEEGFSLAQLNEIRKAKISRILLDNSHLQKVPKDAFLMFDIFLNPMVNAENSPEIDVRSWDE